MLSEASGRLPNGEPFRLWVCSSPQPGRTADSVVIAVAGSVFLAFPVAAVQNARPLQDLGSAVTAATEWTRDEQQARRAAADRDFDVRAERTADAADSGEVDR